MPSKIPIGDKATPNPLFTPPPLHKIDYPDIRKSNSKLSEEVAVHLDLKNFLITDPCEIDGLKNQYTVEARIMAEIADMTDKAIVQRIIDYAKENCIGDIYLLDENFVKKAIEKQMPEKPIGDLHSCPHYRCPNCNRGIVLYESDHKFPCCQWCGKQLDWSDV